MDDILRVCSFEDIQNELEQREDSIVLKKIFILVQQRMIDIDKYLQRYSIDEIEKLAMNNHPFFQEYLLINANGKIKIVEAYLQRYSLEELELLAKSNGSLLLKEVLFHVLKNLSKEGKYTNSMFFNYLEKEIKHERNKKIKEI